MEYIIKHKKKLSLKHVLLYKANSGVSTFIATFSRKISADFTMAQDYLHKERKDYKAGISKVIPAHISAGFHPGRQNTAV